MSSIPYPAADEVTARPPHMKPVSDAGGLPVRCDEQLGEKPEPAAAPSERRVALARDAETLGVLGKGFRLELGRSRARRLAESVATAERVDAARDVRLHGLEFVGTWTARFDGQGSLLIARCKSRHSDTAGTTWATCRGSARIDADRRIARCRRDADGSARCSASQHSLCERGRRGPCTTG
ncbi:MAG: hypothetical protein AB7P21_20640 [Lautropia sp.]